MAALLLVPGRIDRRRPIDRRRLTGNGKDRSRGICLLTDRLRFPNPLSKTGGIENNSFLIHQLVYGCLEFIGTAVFF